MSAPEAQALRRMRTSVTATFVVVLSVYAGVALLISWTSWWHPVLLLPSMLAGLWAATRWDRTANPQSVVAALTLGWVTWALGAYWGVSPAAAFGLSVAGAVTVSKLRGSCGPAAALLVAVVLSTGLLALVDHQDQAAAYLLVAPAVSAVLVLVFWLNRVAWQLFTELDATRRAETDLAIMKERFRFASDLHDIQGHTLHVVKLKTALAQKLLKADPDTAKVELEQVRELIVQTISQTRSLAYGQRKLTLLGELENAKNLFEAAGIEVDVMNDGLPGAEYEETLSLVLREATTNILRHSQVTTVSIVLAPSSIGISNDGCAPGPTPALRGLADLRQRVADAGGELVATKTEDRFFTAACFDSSAVDS